MHVCVSYSGYSMAAAAEKICAFGIQIVPQKKDFCLRVQMACASLPDTISGYMQCRVLHSLTHLQARLRQVGMPGIVGIRQNGTYKGSNDVEDRPFISFNLNLA